MANVSLAVSPATTLTARGFCPCTSQFADTPLSAISCAPDSRSAIVRCAAGPMAPLSTSSTDRV